MSIDAGAKSVHSRSGDFNFAAVATLRAAGNIDGRTARIRESPARFDCDRTSGTDALRIDFGLNHGIGTKVGAVGGNQLTVIADGALRESNASAQTATVRTLGEKDLFSGKQANLSARSGNGAVIFDFIGNQESGAALADIKVPIVDDFGS